MVNASGAWVDETNGVLETRTNLIGGTKGSHLILEHPELLATLNGEMIFYENPDGRVCIVFPYHGKVMAGSTDIPVTSPEATICTPAEQRYILDSLAHIFPALTVGDEHVVFRFCGVRPLPTSDADTPGQVSRDHAFKVFAPSDGRAFPLYALVGGKWTTFRGFAEGIADSILKDLGCPRKVSSERLVIGGGQDYPRSAAAKERYLQTLRQSSGVSKDILSRLFDRYGTRLNEAIPFIREDHRPLTSLPAYTAGEVRFLIQRERTQRLSDLVTRRTLVAMLGNANALALRELATLMSAELSWTPEHIHAEIWATTSLLETVYGMSLEPVLRPPLQHVEHGAHRALAAN